MIKLVYILVEYPLFPSYNLFIPFQIPQGKEECLWIVHKLYILKTTYLFPYDKIYQELFLVLYKTCSRYKCISSHYQSMRIQSL